MNVENQHAWRAAKHAYGPGKIHVVDNDEEAPHQTLCGKRLREIGGQAVCAVVDCKACEMVAVRRRERAANQAEWDKRNAEREARDVEQNRAWWAEYEAYLKTPAWKEKSKLAIERAGFTCEGCGFRRATQAHHMTYEHVGNEFLWELKAVCEPCHERFHESKKARRR